MNGSLLLRNGVFRTMEPRAPLASAVAIRDGRFLHVGEEAGARAALAGADAVQELDLGGRCVLPGLTDSHLHFMWYAQSLHGVDVETATLAEALERVRARAREAAPGTWITGSGWNHNVWANAAFPDKLSLDQAAPRNPVVLEAKNGHALWVSSAALERAGIGLDTADPPGGKIVHGGDGTPSGVLLDNAMRLVQAVVPRPSVSELAHMMRRAQTEAHRLGLTGIHDFDRTLAFEAFQGAARRGPALPSRGQGDPPRGAGAGNRARPPFGFWRRHAETGRRQDVRGRRPGVPDRLDARAVRGHMGHGDPRS